MVIGIGNTLTGSRTSGVSIPNPVALGTIFTDTSFAAGPKYAISGSGISYTGGQINMTGGTATFNDYITLVDPTFPFNYTCLEQWTVSIKCVTPTIGAGSYGLGIGVRSSNPTIGMNALFRWCWDTSAPAAMNMYPNNSLTSQLSSGTFTSPGSGVTVYFDVTRNKNVYTATGYQSDHTTVMKTATFTMSLASGATNQANNTGRFVIENFGGTNIRITEWTITTPALKFPTWAVMGDSNTYGMFAGSNANRYAEHAITAASKTGTICAGIDDHTQDLLNRLPEILVGIQPTKGVVINIGSNDVADGVGTGTWQANITSLVNQVLAAGKICILVAPFARNTNDLTPVQTYCAGVSGVTFLDLFTPTLGVGTAMNAAYNSGDGIHGNLACNNAVYPLLQAIL